MRHHSSEDLDLTAGPRHGSGRVVGLLLGAAVLAALAWGGVVVVRDGFAALGRPRCQATALGNSVTFSPEQMHHAATITGVASRRGLPARAASIALATALQESKLRNITYGDRDSLGLFQQRPSQGWGTREQILDPVFATNAFYDALVKVDGWESMDITRIAQTVQRSAFPEAYADHEQEGRILASALAGHSPEGLGCRLRAAEGSGDPQDVATDAQAETVATTLAVEGNTVTATGLSADSAWAVGSWAVGQSDSRRITQVRVGDRAWVRDRGRDGWRWHPVSGTAGTVTITVN